jgi:carbamoyltransferase
MRYVGFSEYYHDAALSIINDDGTVEFATHGERYSKKKNDPILHDSLWDLVRDDDHVAFYENIEYKKAHRKDLTTKDGRHHHQNSVTAHEQIPVYDSIHYDSFNEHHQSHCASAFYTRPWSDSETTVMVSIDGVGEYQTATIYDHNFNLLKEWHYPKSVGLVYTSATKYLGLRPLEDEYVVMGLSSYGQAPDEMVQWLINWWEDTNDIAPEVERGIKIDVEESYSFEIGNKMRHRLYTWVDEYSREDYAAGVQKFAEYAMMQIMKIARQYGNKLCYSGGCAQNVTFNSQLVKLFDEVHIAVSPTDAGSSLGTAAMAWARQTGKDQLIWTPYLGYNIDREINPREVVDHLLRERVCGLANGRAEFGPRALGNRSLIADVRYDVKDTVNTIKRRQKYRPFAPAILEEYADQYFEGPMNEYMQFTSKALHDYSSVTHVDGTARVQIVKKDCQSVFRKVIEEYYDRTGVPMLLNTSLNIRGRPMVNDEHDAELWEQKYKVRVF